MERRRQFYGRRHGHKLRAGRQAHLQNLLPDIAIELTDPVRATLVPAELFSGSARAVWLEIGFGGGEHLAWQAAVNPDIGIIGCEPFVNGVAALCQRIDEDGLNNVRLYTDDARVLLEALPDASIERLFVLFPDPWPKKKHHKRRIINPETIGQFARILVDGGMLRVATDDPSYMQWILMHLGRTPVLEWTARRAVDWAGRGDDWPGTRYEAKALAAGRRPVYLTYRRVRREHPEIS